MWAQASRWPGPADRAGYRKAIAESMVSDSSSMFLVPARPIGGLVQRHAHPLGIQQLVQPVANAFPDRCRPPIELVSAWGVIDRIRITDRSFPRRSSDSNEPGW